MSDDVFSLGDASLDALRQSVTVAAARRAAEGLRAFADDVEAGDYVAASSALFIARFYAIEAVAASRPLLSLATNGSE